VGSFQERCFNWEIQETQNRNCAKVI